MDAFARGLKIASQIRADGTLDAFVKERYGSWDEEFGARIEAGEMDMRSLEAYVLQRKELRPNQSGRQEMLEHLINQYI
jgi:xylose isomerase